MPQNKIGRFGAATRESDVAAIGPDKARDLVARIFDGLARTPAGAVGAGGVSEVHIHCAQHGVPHDLQWTGRSCVVEIDLGRRG
jgi:hypothetical protein